MALTLWAMTMCCLSPVAGRDIGGAGFKHLLDRALAGKADIGLFGRLACISGSRWRRFRGGGRSDFFGDGRSCSVGGRRVRILGERRAGEREKHCGGKGHAGIEGGGAEAHWG